MNKFIISTLFAGILLLGACSEDKEEFDTEAPTISVEYPAPCAIEKFGDMIRLKANLSDNEGLGSYKLNIHHNFDHHTHGNHQEVCEMDEIKTATNPFLKDWSANLPNEKSMVLDTSFQLPADMQGGDYHALLYVTDINGNQSWTGISIKIIEN